MRIFRFTDGCSAPSGRLSYDSQTKVAHASGSKDMQWVASACVVPKDSLFVDGPDGTLSKVEEIVLLRRKGADAHAAALNADDSTVLTGVEFRSKKGLRVMADKAEFGRSTGGKVLELDRAKRREKAIAEDERKRNRINEEVRGSGEKPSKKRSQS